MEINDVFDQVFETDHELPVVNKTYRNILSIYNLIKTDWGDSVNGERIKNQSRKELAFAYFYVNGDYNEHKEKDKIDRIKKRISLADDWKISDKLQLVINELTEDTVLDAYDKLLAMNIKSANVFIDLIGEIIETSTQSIDELRKGLDLLDEDQIKQRNEVIKSIKVEFKSMVDMGSQLKGMMEQYDELVLKRKEKKRNISRGKRVKDPLQNDRNIYKRKS